MNLVGNTFMQEIEVSIQVLIWFVLEEQKNKKEFQFKIQTKPNLHFIPNFNYIASYCWNTVAATVILGVS
jgi:hypothetical protein